MNCYNCDAEFTEPSLVSDIPGLVREVCPECGSSDIEDETPFSLGYQNLFRSQA